ncbi:glycosyltransferase [Solilutibacter silvestris]|uniref:Glycosyltransferase n=1 Tax=Solilutibacter silvestris TaxID=1645665 RepID=A0A2K1PZE5_9GAMM|nr:glycosyltransferase [Lysobacter silvestris]PNS08149.1 Glycosyltransferase [Lysobacter silvestris]
MESSSTSATSPEPPAGLLVVTDTSLSVTGGSEQFLRSLLRGLPRHRYAVTVVELASGAIVPMPSLPGIKVLRVPVAAVYGRSGLRAYQVLRRLLSSGRYDIVQSQHEKADVLNALLPKRRGVIHISNRRDMGFKKSNRLKHAFRLLNHRFDRVVAPARQILDALATHEHLPLCRATVIPNGVDTLRYRPREATWREARRRALGLGVDTVVFCCVARLTEVKCPLVLVDAFARLHAEYPDVRLLLAGDGPMADEVRRKVDASGLAGNIDLLGSIDAVDDLLPACDVAVLASSSEGMSNALLEAMACGLPVVATAVGGNLQLVKPGVNGVLVPAHDPAAFAEAMLSLARDAHRRHDLGQRARRIVEEEFSAARMIIAYDHLYRGLLGLA